MPDEDDAGGGGGSPWYVITIASYGGPSSDGPTGVNSGGGVSSRSILLNTVSCRRSGRSSCAEEVPAEDCNGDGGRLPPPRPASAYHAGRSLVVRVLLLTRSGRTVCGGEEGGDEGPAPALERDAELELEAATSSGSARDFSGGYLEPYRGLGLNVGESGIELELLDG